MTRYLADTHALYWYLADSPRLSGAASRAFDSGDAGEAEILLPAIVVAELYYLNVKLGSPLSFGDVLQYLQTAGQYAFIPFNAEDVADFDHDHAIPEMHDRMIVGAARRLGAKCLTADQVIRSSGLVEVVWA